MFKFFGISDSIKEDKNLKTLDIEEKEEDILELGQVALDIIEQNDAIIIIAPIAGVDLEDIEITADESILTISGERKQNHDLYSSGIVRNTECFWGKFVRNIILPDNMDFDNIKATMENNLLLIKIPKIRFDSKSIKIDKID